MDYDIIIWDFNGTMLNDVQLCYQILNTMLQNHHLPTITLQEYKDVFNFPVKEYYQKVGFDVSNYHEFSLEFMDLYQKASLSCHLYPYLKTILKRIHKKKILQVCLSASQIDNLKMQLQHFKIDSYFDFVLGLDNIHAKSKIQIGTNWLQSQGYENKKILCIGDSLHDLEVAKALNADCILVSYGHFSKHRLLHHQCLVVDHLKELKDYLNL